MKVKRLVLLAVSASFVSGISTVNAAQISNSLTGLAAPGFIQTFESPAPSVNSVINTAFANISSPTLYYDGNNAGGGNCAFYQESGNCVTNFQSFSPGVPSNTNTTFSIFFDAPQTAAAFALVTGGRDSDTFTALLNGVSVASFVAITDSNYPVNGSGTNGGNYFGFSGIAGGFNEIRVQTTGSNFAVIDNVQLGASIPEPGTIGLLSLGIGGFVALRRRRSA